MSGYNPREVFANPVKLVVGPTNLAAGPPSYGTGTPLGYVRAAKLVKRTEWAFSDSEGRGRSHVETYRGMSGAQLWFILEQATDPNAVNNVMANTQVSPNNYQGANILSLPQVGLNVSPGLVTPGPTLLVAADDPTKPSFIVYAPSWREEESEDINMVIDKPYEWGFVVEIGLDNSNRDMQIDKIENLSL